MPWPIVHPLGYAEEPDNWRDFAAPWLRERQLPSHIALRVAGPSARNPEASHRVEFLRLEHRVPLAPPAR
jgi:pyruvate kinase